MNNIPENLISESSHQLLVPLVSSHVTPLCVEVKVVSFALGQDTVPTWE